MTVVRVQTDIGWFQAGVEDGVVRHSGFTHWPGAVRGDAQVYESLAAYFAGDVDRLDEIPVRSDGSSFQQRVWAALREIPAGETVSYVDLARTIGAPGAPRAVGRANATNPIGVIVPCHRVVRADGTIGGYGGGVERKRWLLTHERVGKSALVT
jgi:methylated-DNA-[protein]-cysteine S-methyltransferase